MEFLVERPVPNLDVTLLSGQARKRVRNAVHLEQGRRHAVFVLDKERVRVRIFEAAADVVSHSQLLFDLPERIIRAQRHVPLLHLLLAGWPGDHDDLVSRVVGFFAPLLRLSLPWAVAPSLAWFVRVQRREARK